MNHTTKLLIVLALAVGCDQQEFLKKEVVAAPTAKDRAAPERKLATTPVVVAPDFAAASSSGRTFSSLSECLTSCDDVNAKTDQKTCSLNCETAYGAEARGAVTAEDRDEIAQATECLGRCSGSDDAACNSSCKTMAAQTSSPLPDKVFTQLETCVKQCHNHKSVRATDQATCELNCAQVARVKTEPPPSALAAKPGT